MKEHNVFGKVFRVVTLRHPVPRMKYIRAAGMMHAEIIYRERYFRREWDLSITPMEVNNE